ncbi:Response regulator protein TodT [Methylobacterium adhaesivum]|jgi:FixJ family two-component response regulator|uniref:Response regulator n=1 Tax=Methylobacterium adhaesivum TaxID=333297 RepID=A0ABT8BMD5_9HYPH|nr:response regulator [Methylobacterium adhaesivum]MDN3592993.1 response regulator [Methylobacterium adhaesivum]GJD30934.1 Response regulator protein TodT [Methylobacterium adhaesivum]
MSQDRSAPLFVVVDDDPATLHSTCFLLESRGHRVEAFTDGEDLLASFPGPKPCCVLLDQVMPGLDGLDVAGRLRALDALIPVILITGHPAPGIRRRARAAGVPLIEKPFDYETLLGLLAAPPGSGERAVPS